MLLDFRFACRLLRRSPMFAGVAVLSLALGIGANTAIFSVMDALLLRALPVRQPEQLVTFGDSLASGIFTAFPNGNFSQLYSVPFYEQVRRNARSFSGVAAIESMRADVHARVAGSLEAEALKVRLVSGNYFQLLGVGAAAGRVLAPDDNGPVAVMSHAIWERRFARDPHIVGQTLTFNGSVFTVVGVAAREFFGTIVGETPDLWIPLAVQARVQPWLDNPTADLSQSLWILARLNPTVTPAAAQSETSALYLGWLSSVAGPKPSADRAADLRTARAELTDASRGMSRMRRRFSQPLRILMAAVGLVLLIACVNVANLLLARASGRRREIAVRLALGAGRRRLVSQLLSEAMLLAGAGGLAGIWIASWGAPLLVAMVSNTADPAPLRVGADVRVLLFTLALTLLTGAAFGILPALRMSGASIAPLLKEGKGSAAARTPQAFGRVLVGAQVALALCLLIGAGLFVRTLQNLEQADPGFDKDRVVLVQIDPNSSGSNVPALVNTYRRIEQRVRSLPGVRSAAYSMLAFDDGQWATPFWPAGVPHTEGNMTNCTGNRVEAEYFAAMGMPIVLGRGFGPGDTPRSQHVAVVNETLARMLSPGASPLGRRFSLGSRDKYDFEIVGVVKDARYESLREKPRAMWHIFNDQEDGLDGFNDLVIRVEGSPQAAMSQIRAVIRGEDPNFGVAEMATLGDLVGRTLATERLLAKLAGLFGALALLLSAIGLYGVLAYSVARRTNEIGIRMALGAQPRSVVALVLRESLAVVAVGVAAGIGAALACGRLVAAQLFGVAPHDLAAIAGATGILLAIALAAAWLPARRAARLDPLAALRE